MSDDVYVPYLRRRNSPAQLDALNRLFDSTPHPTRAQRQALANEIGMELKSVTNWFQNKRQTARRKSNENNHRAAIRRSNTPLDRSKISLDCIAALSERPSTTLQLNPTRLPLTPHKSNIQQKNPPGASELWTHMLSSPVMAPSDPDPEEARLAAMSSRENVRYALEWACLQARQKNWADEDGTTHREADAHGDPPHDTIVSRLNMPPQLEDVEAAITLLGFKTRS